MKLSVIIPTLNAAPRLPLCLDALVTPMLGGMVKKVIVVDGGSTDETLLIADGFGATILTAPPGRGGQLRVGAKAARGDWLLFLHGDTVLEEGWVQKARTFINAQNDGVGVFTLAFAAKGVMPQLVAAGAMLRTKIFNLPYGDQGVLISNKTYEEIGGYCDMPLMEDVEFMRRLMRLKGRGAMTVFSSRAVTSAARYQRDGYLRRVFGNLWTLLRYRLGVSPEDLKRGYN